MASEWSAFDGDVSLPVNIRGDDGQVYEWDHMNETDPEILALTAEIRGALRLPVFLEV